MKSQPQELTNSRGVISPPKVTVKSLKKALKFGEKKAKVPQRSKPKQKTTGKKIIHPTLMKTTGRPVKKVIVQYFAYLQHCFLCVDAATIIFFFRKICSECYVLHHSHISFFIGFVCYFFFKLTNFKITILTIAFSASALMACTLVAGQR